MTNEPERKAVRSRWVRVDLPTGETIEVQTERRGGYVHTVGIRALEGQSLTPELLRRIPVGRITNELASPLAPAIKRIRLGAIPKLPRGTPDEQDRFYAEVAKQYLLASEQSHRPSADIAEGLAISVRTVQGWVAEARRRGHLPAGRRGTRG